MEKDTKIYVILTKVPVYDSYGMPTGEFETVVSHGVGNITLNNYILPDEVNGCKEDGGGLYLEVIEQA
jgi:hypothetical protein